MGISPLLFPFLHGTSRIRKVGCCEGEEIHHGDKRCHNMDSPWRISTRSPALKQAETQPIQRDVMGSSENDEPMKREVPSKRGPMNGERGHEMPQFDPGASPPPPTSSWLCACYLILFSDMSRVYQLV